MAVIQGAYSATWNALDLGNTVSGFELSYMSQARPVTFDAVGETPIDMLLSGMAMVVDMVLAEYDAAAIATMSWPWNADRGVMPIAGTSLFTLAKPLVLTSCLTIDPATITFHKTILSPSFNTRVLFSGTQPRYLPFQLYVFPIKEDSESTPLIPAGCNETQFFVETLQP